MNLEAGAVCIKARIGGGAAQEMLAEDLPQIDPGWSPDGKQMVFGHPRVADA